jgi:hypothetical protein
MSLYYCLAEVITIYTTA